MKTFFVKLAGSSVLWGLVAAFLYYFGINAGLIRNETIVRYSTGHPVEYVTIAMFWVGACDLLFKIYASGRERKALRRGALFPPKKREKESLDNVESYLDTVAKAREVRGESGYLTRLSDALLFLKYGGSPDDLDQELRCLADDAWDARDSEYGMVRTFIWAIPILGFLGTVLGITVALGNLDLTQIESTGDALAAGLKVAFDTTALALSLVFVLYFMQFFSKKQDAALALTVTRLVDSELKGRFQAEVDLGSTSRELEATRRFLQTVSGAFEDATKAQTALWGETMANAAKQSADVMREAAERVGETIDQRLTGGSEQWGSALAGVQREFIETTLRPILDEASKRAERLDALEEKMQVQAETLNDALAASADVAAIEERLTRTLEKIAEVGEFEKTLNNLSATVCLLNSKLTGALPTTSNYSETLRFDQSSSRRAARRGEALAALDSLENSLGADLQPLNFQELSAKVEVDPEAKVDDPEPVVYPTPSLVEQDEESAPKKGRARTKRSA